MNTLRIETLFSQKSERTIQNLSKIYDNSELLKERIRKVGRGVLDNKYEISNKKVLLKPNWVVHNKQEIDEICLRTHENFLIAALEIVLELKPKMIVIGDAPIQRCQWNLMFNKNFLKSIERLSEKYKIPLIVKDFRRVTFDPEFNNPIKERNPLSDYYIFDLGTDSHLEPISSEKNKFRVTSYNPDRLAESHRTGVHKYCITKELFEADIIISIPKIKTHQKTGITGALKNIVGLNGDKDFLPHHRVGGIGFGGDCYPGKNIFRRISEYALDNANRNQGKNSYWVWYYLSLVLWKFSNPKNVHQIAAGWYGNDTTWRMVMDLNKIVVYGKGDGTLSKEPQRMLYSLCDGIIGGQGDGPLNPQPLPLGIICFSNNSYLTDICVGTLMGFDIQKISLLRNALNKLRDQKINILLNEKDINLSILSKYSLPTLPPPGWVNYL